MSRDGRVRLSRRSSAAHRTARNDHPHSSAGDAPALDSPGRATRWLGGPCARACLGRSGGRRRDYVSLTPARWPPDRGTRRRRSRARLRLPRPLQPHVDDAEEAMLAVEVTGRQALRELSRLLGILRTDDGPRLEPLPGLAELEPLVEQMRLTGPRTTRSRCGTSATSQVLRMGPRLAHDLCR